MPGWLPLLNYSTKYNVSLSTLRRRIKARTIEFKLDQGKYLILDSAPEPLQQVAAPAVDNSSLPFNGSPTEVNHSTFVEASVLTSANRLVEEIKSAYAKILQEKEEQISQLKEEIIDLRMLVRILEDTSKSNSVLDQKKSERELTPPDSIDYLFGDFQKF